MEGLTCHIGGPADPTALAEWMSRLFDPMGLASFLLRLPKRYEHLVLHVGEGAALRLNCLMLVTAFAEHGMLDASFLAILLGEFPEEAVGLEAVWTGRP